MLKLSMKSFLIMTVALIVMVDHVQPQMNNVQQRQLQQQQAQRSEREQQPNAQRPQQQTINRRGPQQRINPNQQQSLRRPQQSQVRPQQQGNRRVQNQQQPNPRAPVTDKRPNYQLPLTEMTPELLKLLISREQDVIILTNCIEHYASCTDKDARNLLDQVSKLGLRGICDYCDEKQQAHINDMIYKFMVAYRDNYPKHFRKVLPFMAHLISQK